MLFNILICLILSPIMKFNLFSILYSLVIPIPYGILTVNFVPLK